MKSFGRVCVAVAILLSVENSLADGRPLREARSDNGRFVLRVNPGRTGPGGRSCQATLYELKERRQPGQRTWERPLVNDVAPAQAFVRDDGQFVVTLDEYRRGGARHAVVIYGARGELLRHFLLPDLLEESDWKQLRVSRREITWLKDARFKFADKQDHFVIELAWGREIRIDLKTLQVVRTDERRAGGVMSAIPVEALALLLGHLAEDGQQVIGERLAELAERIAGERTQPERMAAEQATEEPTEQAAKATAEVAVAPEPGEPLPSQSVVEEQRAAPAGEDEPLAGAEPEGAMETAGDSEVPPEGWAVEPPLTQILVPEPNPAEKVDYVAWLNEMGRVEGPDADPVYQAATEEVVEYEGDGELLRAAMRGDANALASPEIAEWLASNEAALATFREASQYGAKGWHLHSDDGSLVGVLLPRLSSTRALLRASVIDGQRLLANGRPAEAAARYLDGLAAGAHTGSGMTIIENLVGVAMQTAAARALLDLQADPLADTLDGAELAAELEAAYRPVRSAAETLQGERACFLDTVQRIWDADPVTGTHQVNRDVLTQYGVSASAVVLSNGDSPEGAPLADAAQLEQIGYQATAAAGNAAYDELTRGFTEPFAEGRARLDQMQSRIENDPNVNPLVRAFVPALSRYHFLATRAETTRRASLLTANLRAYRQQHGEYPTSLEVFADREFVRDPFSNTGFAYRRQGDDFILYSVGGNGVDDGGVHDRRGEANDLRFWPRPGLEAP